MNSFLRFILVLLVAGAALNLVVVLAANTHAHRQVVTQNAKDRDEMLALVKDVSGRQRRANMVVESQTLDAHGMVTSTTLLVRQYHDPGAEMSHPLAISRVVIPGDRVAVDAAIFEPDDTFAADAEEFQFLRKSQLIYFSMICGESEALPPATPMTPATDARFNYLVHGLVPELTRIRPGDENPSPFEARLWQYIWDVIPDPLPADITAAPNQRHEPIIATKNGLKITWTKPTVITAKREHTYTAFVGSDGNVSLEQDARDLPADFLDSMLADAKRSLDTDK